MDTGELFMLRILLLLLFRSILWIRTALRRQAGLGIHRGVHWWQVNKTGSSPKACG